MFTGIIESTAEVLELRKEGTNIHFKMKSDISSSLKVDQSVNHDGVCLTVVDLGADWHEVTAVKETLDKTNLKVWKKGTLVNIERSMPASGRFDGHIVQGHVDQVGKLESLKDEEGSKILKFSYKDISHITVEKGSITINGISLTCFNSTQNSFCVAIIPYTWDHTNIGDLKPGSLVNLEFDIVGKYIEKLIKRN